MTAPRWPYPSAKRRDCCWGESAQTALPYAIDAARQAESYLELVSTQDISFAPDA